MEQSGAQPPFVALIFRSIPISFNGICPEPRKYGLVTLERANRKQQTKTFVGIGNINRQPVDHFGYSSHKRFLF